MEKEKKNNRKKKNKKDMIIIMALLVLLVAGLVGFIGYETGLFKEKSNKSGDYTEKMDEEDLEYKITTRVKNLSFGFGKYFPITDFSKIKNQDLLNYASLKGDKMKGYFAAPEFNKIIYDIFGNSVTLTHEDIQCHVAGHAPVYLYKDSIYKLNVNHQVHTICPPPDAEPMLISLDKKGNNIIAKYRIMYFNYSCNNVTDHWEVYKSSQDSVNQTNMVFKQTEKIDDWDSFVEETYREIESKLPVTVFEFEDDGLSYNLKSVTIR